MNSYFSVCRVFENSELLSKLFNGCLKCLLTHFYCLTQFKYRIGPQSEQHFLSMNFDIVGV